jgi:hypothetical protein
LEWDKVYSGGNDGRAEPLKSTKKSIVLDISSRIIKKYVDANLDPEQNYIVAIRESMIYGQATEIIIYKNKSNQTNTFKG